MLLSKPQKTMILCSCFISGCTAYFLNSLFLLIFIAVLSISVLIYKKIFSLKFSALCLIIIAFSIFYCDFKTPKPDELYKISPANAYLKGRVITEPQLNLKNRTKFEFEVYSYKLKNENQKNIKAKTIVNIYDKKQNFKKILIGDVIEVQGFVKTPFEATNPGQFDYKNYLKNKGIFTLTYVKYNNFNIISHPQNGKWFIIQNLNKIKNKIISTNRKYIKSPKLEVLEGMVFGDFAVPAPDEVKQDFMKSGLLHLLAASGMNVGFVFGAWFFVASKLKIPYKIKMIAGGVFVLFYSVLTGLPPSIMRAAIMAEFLILAKLLDRKADTLVILVLVCSLMLLYDPFLLANISFQLSFLTTFGILLCVQPVLNKIKSIPEAVSATILVPLIAQIWASPIQIFHFNNFSTYSLLANILVVPFVGIITFLGFIGSFFIFIPVIGKYINFLFCKISEPFIDIILFVSGYIAHLPHSVCYLAKPEMSTVIIFYGFVIALLYAIIKNFSSKKLNIFTLILFLSLLFSTFKDNFNQKLELVFFDVGQGDAILVHLPNNKNFLVDTGPNEKYLPAKTSIIPYLRDKGINKLDFVLLTHDDSDHIGGALEILKNIKVKNVFHTGLIEDSKTCKTLKNYIQKNHINNKILSDGESINLNKNIRIKVIRSYKNSQNENGIILYISYKDFSAILMADCEADSVYGIEKHVKEPVQIIKIGHHGSYESVNYSLLDYLRPQLAVISVGKKGYKYGHPNKEVLQELKEFNIKTFRTDKDFAVTITSDGENYNYQTFKKQRDL